MEALRVCPLVRTVVSRARFRVVDWGPAKIRAKRVRKQKTDRRDRESAPRASGCGPPTGGSAWFGSGFGAADHRRSRGASQYVLFGSRVDVLGRNLSRQR